MLPRMPSSITVKVEYLIHADDGAFVRKLGAVVVDVSLGPTWGGSVLCTASGCPQGPLWLPCP
jgi:hypothetical protein